MTRPKVTSNEAMDRLNKMKKLDTKQPKDVLPKVELPKPTFEKVKEQPTPKIVVNISTFDYVKLWLVSWFRNEAKAELQGKHSPLPFDLKGGFPAKTATIIAAVIAILTAVSC